MVSAGNEELIERFIKFYSKYYRDKVEELAQQYPNEQRSLYIDYEDLYEFDADLAKDFRDDPGQMRDYAEEGLRLYDLPADVNLGKAHVRITNIPDTISIRDIRVRDNYLGELVAIEGIIRSATDVQPKIQNAAFECQRCGSLTPVAQTGAEYQEPHECQGCERQGPFQLNVDQSEFVDAQTIHLLEDPTNLSKEATPQEIEVTLKDDITGQATAGDRVRITGILHLEQEGSKNQLSTNFSLYMEGVAVESLGGHQPTEPYDRPPAVPDLNAYADLASGALSTLPEHAREEETKAKLITPFVEALGWNKYDSTEIRLEYTDAKTTLRPDYALFGPGSDIPDVVIEAKQLGTNLEEEEGQLYDYLRVFSAEWGVLTNGEEFYVYRRKGEDHLPEKLAEMHISDLPRASIVDSLKRSAFYEDT